MLQIAWDHINLGAQCEGRQSSLTMINYDSKLNIPYIQYILLE